MSNKQPSFSIDLKNIWYYENLIAAVVKYNNDVLQFYT